MPVDEVESHQKQQLYLRSDPLLCETMVLLTDVFCSVCMCIDDCLQLIWWWLVFWTGNDQGWNHTKCVRVQQLDECQCWWHGWGPTALWSHGGNHLHFMFSDSFWQHVWQCTSLKGFQDAHLTSIFVICISPSCIKYFDGETGNLTGGTGCRCGSWLDHVQYSA